MLKTMVKHMKKDTSGFSLVELMVVVVIIGVLVAIAIPVYNATTDRAEEGACFANLRMLEGAKAQYEMNTGEDLTSIDDLADYFQNGVPECPSEGGGYNLDEGKISCTKHGHYSDEESSSDSGD